MRPDLVRFLRRVRHWASRSRLDADLAREIDTHRAMTRERFERLGYDADAAISASARALGNTTLSREDARGVWFAPWLESIAQDLRIAARSLIKRPGVTCIAVLTMALGIGANTAVFSLLDASLFKALPVPHPEQLAFLSQVDSTGEQLDFSYPEFQQLRNASHTVSGMAAFDGSRFSATVDGRPALIHGDFVSGNYFDLLGVHAAAGRTFTAADDQPGLAPVAVISTTYWTGAFGRDPHVIGRVITLGGMPFTVVGVTPPEFRGNDVTGTGPDIVIPMAFHGQLALRDHVSFGILARLKPSVSLVQATEELGLLHRHFLSDSSGAALSPAAARDLASRRLVMRAGLHGANGQLGPDDARQTLIVIGIVALVLLIACVNVASLLVARAADRQKEFAVRLSIGASRGRMIRQLLTESTLLAAIGGAVGLLCAEWGAHLLGSMLPLGALTFHPVTSPECLALTAALALGTGLAFGLIPAVSGTRVDLSPVLRGSDMGGSARAPRQRLARMLVIAQIGLSMTLLIGAGLLVRSLQNLRRTEPGFAANQVLAIYVYPVLLGYDHDRELNLYRDMLARLSTIPGVSSTSLVRYWIGSGENIVAPGYFSTMGIGFERGRDFSATTDQASAPKVAILSDAAARLQFGTDDPVGRILTSGDHAGAQVIGVVRNIKHSAWQEAGDPTVYTPYAQAPPGELGQIQFLVRTSGDPLALARAVRAAVTSIEPSLPILSLQTEAEALGQSMGDEKSVATLLSGFGVLALVLAAIGLYGTMSHAVMRRTREFGIRMSLGADATGVLRLVLRETAGLVALGLVAGVPMALAGTRLIASLLFHVAPTDAVAIGGVMVLMATVAVCAGAIPAYRAARVDPMIALRHS
jgi:predicted permease